jgi:EmrB/QacA subfamily drug resistance transporter
MISQAEKEYALIVTFLASFLTPFMGSSINIALPTIANEFSINAILLSWIPTAYLLSLAIFLIPFGRIADIYGRKKIFTYGIIIFTISSFIATFSISGLMLIIIRVIQGMGASMIFGNVAAIIASIFAGGERGRALGITVTGVFLGLFLGPVLGGIFTENLGWRSIFLFNVPIGIIVTIAVLRMKGEWAEAVGEKFDVIGSVLLGISIITLMYGVSLLPGNSGIYLILAGLVGIIIFYNIEKRVISPVLDVKLFKNRAFALNNIAAFINYCSSVPIVFILSLYLQYIKGFTPEIAGLILSVQPILMTVFSPPAGKLSDRIEARFVASAGMAFTGCGLLLLAFINQSTSVYYIIFGLIIIGIGFAFFSSPNTNAIMNSVESKFYGVASATLSTMRVLGQMSGMGIAILALAIFMGNVKIFPQNYGTFLLSSQISFVIFAILSFLGIFSSLVKQDNSKKSI